MSTIGDVLSGQAQWVVLEADCAEVLPFFPPRSVDHVISDPPYSEHVHKVGRIDKAFAGNSRDFGFSHLEIGLRQTVANEAARTVRRWVLLFSDSEGIGGWMHDCAAASIEHIRIGVWIKPGALPQLSDDRPSAGFESIEIAHQSGRKQWNGGGKPAIWTHPVERGGRVHPTQKPLSLLCELLEDFTDPGELILDPFCGSGSLGIACVRLGRRYIGIDNGKDAQGKPWAEWAREGIQAEEQGVSRGAARAGQLGLFAAQ